MTPTRPQAVRRQTAPPSCARPGRVRDPSPHEPVSTRTLKKEKRQGRSLPLTRKNVALLAAVDRLLEFGPYRKSTRLNSSHGYISYAVFCLKKKKLLLSAIFDYRGRNDRHPS